MSNLEIYQVEFLLYIQGGKSNMFKRIFLLFKIARKLASSGAVDTISEIYDVPTSIKIFFNFISIGSKKNFNDYSKKPGEKLCDALEGMGTTFIKLGQFLATRPDIIGEELAKESDVESDIVVPVPDSGVPAALGFAQFTKKKI